MLLNGWLSGSLDEAGSSVVGSKPGPEQREMADLGLGSGLVPRLLHQSVMQSLGRLHSFLV